MALRPMGFSNAASNLVNSYMMGKEYKARQAKEEEQNTIKSLMGSMLMGDVSDEQTQQFATLSPDKYLATQQYLQGQQDREGKASIAQQDKLNKELDSQRMDFLDWEDDVFDRVKAADPENRSVVYNQLMRQGRNIFNEQFFKDTPEQYNEEIDTFISSLGEESAAELKSGRYKESVAPDGTVYQVDTATGERVKLYDGLPPEVNLKAGMEARLVETQDNARKSAAKSREFSAIADDFEKFDVSGGGFATAWEGLKDFTGQQDYESELRRKWMGIKSSQVVDNLPPGAASDKDIEMAMAGFPPNNASPEIISSFLNGMAKLESENAKYNELEAQWIATQGNTAQAKSDFQFNGMEIGKGETLLEAYKKMAKDTFGDQDSTEPETSASGVIISGHPTFGDITEEDIQATMQKHGMTREDVIERLGQ